MDNCKAIILNKLKDKECTKIFKDTKISIAILFGSILTGNFEEYSDIDIAVLSKENITFNTIIFIEESLQKVLGRDIDVINLSSEDTKLNMKVSIYDNGQIIYDEGSMELYNRSYAEVENLYKDNENFRFFRERDVIFSE